ncbi:MAG: site-specific DNA-methyltransferase [Planctomycetaceae bacterium]|nr:site-specific DNA-methyltransferase [Planctomycetaceae bacterium]
MNKVKAISIGSRGASACPPGTLGFQRRLFPEDIRTQELREEATTTFVDNMRLPVHRWFRFSAGFSAQWAAATIRNLHLSAPNVLDPFAGSGTTLLAAESVGATGAGVEAQPFIAQIARAKLGWRSDPEAYLKLARKVRERAVAVEGQVESYPPLIRKCYDDDTLRKLDAIRRVVCEWSDDSETHRLVWLTLVAILRQVSPAGTAQWQYVLPKKQKRQVREVHDAFDRCCEMIYHDMACGRHLAGPRSRLIHGDARTCEGVPDNWADVVVTSPPYPNNYDYADATRLEMSFMGDIDGWGDLQQKIRSGLVRSCSQHVPERAVNLDEILDSAEVVPIRDELSDVCRRLSEVRLLHGGKKTYHLMVACYFRDLAAVWHALRRCCRSPSRLCFVIGDSAPYGVYVPVVPWLERLAAAAGFKSQTFEKTRDRNVKWKNRKHRVPLLEGRLWVEG